MNPSVKQFAASLRTLHVSLELFFVSLLCGGFDDSRLIDQPEDYASRDHAEDDLEK